jgi:DNA-directed RNA polymerase specialized sigma24 family protein
MKQLQTNIERLSEWIDLYQEQLYRYAFFRLGNRDDAEDVLQDAFLKVAASTTTINNPKAYLYRAVASGCVDMLRLRGKAFPIDEKAITQAHTNSTIAEEEFQRIRVEFGKREQAMEMYYDHWQFFGEYELVQLLKTPENKDVIIIEE